MFFGAYLAVRTREVDIPALNESNVVGYVEPVLYVRNESAVFVYVVPFSPHNKGVLAVSRMFFKHRREFTSHPIA